MTRLGLPDLLICGGPHALAVLVLAAALGLGFVFVPFKGP